MNNKNLLFVFLIFILTIVGCIREDDIIPIEECKDDCVILTGNILANSPSISLEEIKIDVVWDNSGPIGTFLRDKASTKTGKDGYYFLKFPLRDDELNDGFFRVIIHSPEDLFNCMPDNPHGFNFFWLERNFTYITNYYLSEKAKIILKSKGSDELQEDDSFFTKVTSLNGVDNKEMCVPLIQWKKEVKAKVHEIDVAANTQVIIEQNIKKGGIRTITLDTLILSPKETKEITVHF